jgi:hypothetical protein
LPWILCSSSLEFGARTKSIKKSGKYTAITVEATRKQDKALKTKKGGASCRI